MLTDAEIMAQVLAAFQEEQVEHRQAAAELLLELEREPDHPQRRQLLDQLFREAHSLKGGARAAGLSDVEQLAHRVEDLFSAVRTGSLALTPDVCDPVYAALDAIGVMMTQVAAGRPTDLDPHRHLLDALTMIIEAPAAAPVADVEPPGVAAAAAPPPATPEVTARPPAEVESPALPAAPAEPAVPAESVWENGSSTIRLATTMLDSLMNETGELMACTIRAEQRGREARNLGLIPARWRRVWQQVRPTVNRLQNTMPSLRPTVHHLAAREDIAVPLVSGNSTAERDKTQLVEALLQANALIAELERKLTVHTRQVTEDHTRLASVTGRLHDQVRRTRMIPLATILGPLRLQLRETARSAGKQVSLDLDDGGAEADRQVIERLREVLLHLLRNAVDHGIEAPDLRTAANKDPVGRIVLRAEVSGDHLNLTVSDDGAGIDFAAVRDRAHANGMLSDADLARVGEAELADMIFLPGFSTRQQVSTLSGRGVGLDIVRSHVERMHGRVSVQSSPTAGCVFSISVPISLTSSHGLMLRAGKASYVLPLDSVQRIVQVTARDIEVLEGRAALILDGRPVALTHLLDLVGVAESRQVGEKSVAKMVGGRATALLLGSGERQVACMVDAVLGEQQLVMHRLPAPLQQVRFIAGATILADGSVVPILDVVDLLWSAIGARRAISVAPEPAAVREKPAVLVVDDSITTRTLEKNILEAAGYQVRLATDGMEALQALQQMAENGGCSLLLSDVDMPRLNGFELTSRLRADPCFQHLPVVLVTSLDTPADRERGIAAGADAYIVKRSFDQQILLDTIAQLI